MSLLPEKELQAVESWFASLKEALGVSQNADRGRVLASVKKLVDEKESYDREKRVVAQAYGYARWGDLYSWASEKLVATPEVALPEVFSRPPNGWVLRPGGDYDKAEKRLVKTLRRVKEVWAYLESEVATDPTAKEWAAEQRAFFVELFDNSKDPEKFDRSCVAFVRNYEEEDPASSWVGVAEEAAAALDRYYDLPLVVVSELVVYAKDTGVEATKEGVEWTRQTQNPALHWFNYLLTSYLYQNNRSGREKVEEVAKLFVEATDLWGCFELVSANDPDHPTRTKRNYVPSLTLAQVVAALRKLAELKQGDQSGTREDWENAVKEAVGTCTSEEGLTATAWN